jgi:hypothetical protein
MAWLNTPTEIIEDHRVTTETHSYWHSGKSDPTTIVYERRHRSVTWTTKRYVGCDYTAAKAKADELSATAGYEDVHVAPAGGGQYHCIATQKIEGAWSTPEVY